MKIQNNEKVQLCCDIADALLNIDGYHFNMVTDASGDELYSEQEKERFNLIYDAVMELIEQAEEVTE